MRTLESFVAMSGDAAAEQVRKKSGGASWRPLLSVSSSEYSSHVRLSKESGSLVNRRDGVQKNGGIWSEIKKKVDFSVLGVNTNKYVTLSGEMVSFLLDYREFCGWGASI